jgi:hemolysin activation/secretion protein
MIKINRTAKSMMIKLTHRLLASTLWLLSTLVGAAESADDGVGPFDIARYTVSGDTLLGSTSIDQLLTPFIGKQRHFGDVQLAVDALQTAYRDRGFSLVKVQLPEQELNQGVIQLNVRQTPISAVRVLGNTVFGEKNIRHSMPGLREGETLNLTNVSASLALANENPAKKTTLSLQSAEDDASVVATLQVADEKAWATSLSLDNAGGEKTGQTQFTAQVQHFNVAGVDHALSLQFTTTVEQPSRVGVYGVGYHIPLYALGDSVDFYANYSDVDSGTVTTGSFSVQVSGKGTTWGGRYNHRLARVGNLTSTLVFGLEQKAFQNNLGFQGVQLGHDVTVRPLTLTYSGELTDPGSSTSWSLTGVRNMPGGDNAGESDYASTRSQASANYSVVRYSVSHSRALPADWRLRATLSGQLTGDALVPGEQFGAGGANSVRGFTERALSDDQGQLASIELYTPSLCAITAMPALQCQLLVFYDAAQVRHNKALPAERGEASIASAGIGLRLSVGKQLSLQMDLGQVTQGGDLAAIGDQRVHVKLNLAY